MTRFMSLATADSSPLVHLLHGRGAAGASESATSPTISSTFSCIARVLVDRQRQVALRGDHGPDLVAGDDAQVVDREDVGGIRHRHDELVVLDRDRAGRCSVARGPRRAAWRRSASISYRPRSTNDSPICWATAWAMPGSASRPESTRNCAQRLAVGLGERVLQLGVGDDACLHQDLARAACRSRESRRADLPAPTRVHAASSASAAARMMSRGASDPARLVPDPDRDGALGHEHPETSDGPWRLVPRRRA